MRIVEISGIKLEIDERTARTVESYKIGDRVKCLIKSYGDTFNVYPGIITGFAAFAALPTIEIMYLANGELAFKAINATSKDIEIVPLSEAELILDKADALRRMDLAIKQAEDALLDKKQRRAYFVEKFATAFRGDPVAGVPA